MRTLIFQKNSSKTDGVEFIADGKTIALLDNPKQGILPHDLIHALVETQLDLRGFISLVFEGQNPAFAMQADGEAWLAEAMVEAIQGMLWSGRLDLEQFNEWVRSICEQRQVATVVTSPEQFSALSARLKETTERWLVLAPGQSLEIIIPG